MLTGWDSNKKVRIRPGKQLIPSALADITLPVHLNSSSGVYGKDMAAMFTDLDPVDPHWSSVVLAMPMDGANGSTTFTDLTGKTVTCYGNTIISTAQSKFGGASAYFDGSGDCLGLPNSTFAFGTDAFTMEFFINLLTPSSAWPYIMSCGRYSVGGGWIMFHNGSSGWPGTGQIIFAASNTEGGADLNSTVIMGAGWKHVAIVRNGYDYKMFVDGILVDSCTSSVLNNFTSVTSRIFASGETGYLTENAKGYLDELRITKGIARYTESFNPPTRSILTTSPAYSGLNPLAKKIAMEIGDTGVEVPISILTQDWDNADNTAEAAKIYAVFEDLEDGDDFTLYWDSAHADNTNVTEISSAPAAPGSGDALTVWNLASTDDLWLIATEFYTISGTVTVSAVAASRRVVVFDESRIYQSFFSDASDGSYGCFVPSTGPFNIAMIGNAGEYPKIFSGVTAG